MSTTTPQIGDLVDAEYVESIHAPTPAKLRGIVTSVGQWQDKPTYSVSGYDSHGRPASTSQSTMPVTLLAARESEAARNMLDTRASDSSGAMLERLIGLGAQL